MLPRVAHAIAIILVSSFASAATLAAQAPSQSPGTEQAQAPAEKRRCETITLTGSRLAKKKFCGTPAEWAEKRLQDRQAIEKVQMSPCVLQKTGPTGRPSC